MNAWTKRNRIQKKIRPLDVMNQIVSRTKRAKDSEIEFRNKLFLPNPDTSKFYKTKREHDDRNKNKFSELGKVYMTEFSKFQYKVDAIVNNAYLYVRDLHD